MMTAACQNCMDRIQISEPQDAHMQGWTAFNRRWLCPQCQHHIGCPHEDLRYPTDADRAARPYLPRAHSSMRGSYYPMLCQKCSGVIMIDTSD